MTIRLHEIEISPRSVRIDGVPVTVDTPGPSVFTPHPGEDLHIVHIPVLAQSVTLNGDIHAPDAGTPVYDQLVAEIEDERRRETEAYYQTMEARA